MPEVVELQFHANQAFDVINQLQARMTALENQIVNTGGRGGGGDHIGERFLRSERIVSRSAANMATSLLSINDPLNAIANGLLQFEHATKLGLGLAVGLAVGIAAFEIIHKQLVELAIAREKLQRDTAVPLALTVNLSPQDIASKIQTVDKDLQELQKKNAGFISSAFGSRGIGGGGLDFQGAKTGQLSPEVQKPAKDENVEAIKAALEYRRNLLQQAADIELRIAGSKGRIVEVGAQEAAGEKATLDYVAARAKLQTELTSRVSSKGNPLPFLENFQPGSDQLVFFKQLAAEAEKLNIAKNAAGEKGAFSNTELKTAEAIAKFRGTQEERKDFGLDQTLKQDKALLGIAEKYHDIDEVKKLTLKVDQDQLAIDERRVEKAQQQRDLSATREETSIKVKGAQERVNLTGEDAQRSSLREQLDLAREKVGEARKNLAADATSVSNQKAITVALGNQVIAMANLQKFDQERVFNSTQELNNAKSKTRELQLQAAGNTFAAGQEKINAPAESQIAKLLHDNKPEIAVQVGQQADLQGEAQLGARLTETAAQQRAREDAERAAQSAADQAHAAVLDAQNRERNGATLDENNPVTQQLRAEQERAAQLAEGEKPQSAEDFSSVASLAGQDFSSLASLGSLDFSGIATLAGLSITIA